MRAPARVPLHPILLGCLLLGGCAQFGVPEFPAQLRDPAVLQGEIFVVYHPHTVLGLGHTGLIISAGERGRYLRYDQYASAEWEYGLRLREGKANFWEAVTARLPSIFGFTREYVTRRDGATPLHLTARGEHVVPIRGLALAPVRAAAEARYARASRLEQETAARYFWIFNNCHTFLRDVLRAGGPIHEEYFPKHFVAAYLEEFRGGAPHPAPPVPAAAPER